MTTVSLAKMHLLTVTGNYCFCQTRFLHRQIDFWADNFTKPELPNYKKVLRIYNRKLNFLKELDTQKHKEKPSCLVLNLAPVIYKHIIINFHLV